MLVKFNGGIFGGGGEFLDVNPRERGRFPVTNIKYAYFDAKIFPCLTDSLRMFPQGE